jgi:hypothetical protein
MFDVDQVTIYRDSFAILIQGKERGWQRYEMRRAGNGFEYSESAAITGVFERTAVVSLDSDLQVQHVRSSGQMQGRAMGSDIRYANGRGTGYALGQGPSGSQRVQVDTAVAPPAFDGQALMGLITTLAWLPGGVYTLRLYDSEENSITDQELRIEGSERLAVPAGTFDVFRGDLSTTQAPDRIWVTQAVPHRIIKVAGATEDFVTVLVAQSR